jgi:hypothetical protein
MYKRFALLFALGICTIGAFGQQKDFQTWWAVGLNTKLFDKLDLGITPEVRLTNNSSFVRSLISEFDVSYPVTKFLSLGGQYRFQQKNYIDNTSYLVNRYGVYAKIDFKIDKFRFNYRALFQTEYEGLNHKEDGNIPLYEQRHKIAVSYYKKKWDLRPEMSYELFFLTKPNFWLSQFTSRFCIGLEYAINKSMSVSMGYKLQRVYFDNDYLTAHIIAAGFNYRFSQKYRYK